MGKVSVLRNLVNTFFYDWKHYSFGLAVGRFYRDIPVGSWKKRQHYYEVCVLHFLKNKYKSIFEEYKAKPLYEKAEQITKESKHIWVMWWQGESSMPPIVRKCFQSILVAADGVPVTLITKANYKEYVDISEDFIARVEAGKVCIANLSDCIRIELIDRYGGLWIDATVLCSTKIEESFWEQELFTLSAPGLFDAFISKGEWSSFLLYGKRGNSLFRALKICQETYYSEFDTPVDYLLIDYFIRILIDNNSHFRKALNAVPECRDYYAINLMLNSTFEIESYREALEKCVFHKLTYKNIDLNNKKSVYSKIVEEIEGE